MIAVGPGAVPVTTTSPVELTSSGSGLPAAVVAPNEAILYSASGTPKLEVTPFAVSVPGGIRVATADLNGDGVDDLIAATGPGVLDEVVVFDGATGKKIEDFTPFPGFTGGLFVTTGEFEGTEDIIVSPDSGGGPRVTIYQGMTQTVLCNFYGVDNPNFRGGARVAVGDLNGDGTPDLIVAAGPGGGPVVSIYNGTSITPGGFTQKLVGDFFAFGSDVTRDGVYVASGDVNGDGYDDLILGAGAGGGPRIEVLDGRQLVQTGNQVPLADFFSGATTRRDGVPVVARDLTGSGLADIIAGGGSTQAVSVYLAAHLGTSATQSPDLTFDPFPTYNSGVNVG